MRSLLTTLARFVSWHRRAVAAVLGASAVVLFATTVNTPEDLTPVVVLTSDLPAGHAFRPDDLAVRELPPGLVPSHAILTPDEALGRTTAVALSAGTVLQPGLLGGELTAAAGRAIVPISLSDESLRALLRPGDPVSLVAPGPDGLEVITGDARIVALPQSDEGGSRMALASGRATGIVLVDVASTDAGMVASLGQAGDISVVLGSL